MILRGIYRKYLRGTAVGRGVVAAAIFVSRLKLAGGHCARTIGRAGSWLFRSREHTNFSYDLTTINKHYLCEMLAVALDRSTTQIEGYIDEIENDAVLRNKLAALAKSGAEELSLDPAIRYGRRVGWYAIVRALKPRLVVETGVDQGLGAAVLCAALLRNGAEGFAGRYRGTDINPAAGRLLVEPYRSVGTVLYGDSIESLSGLKGPIDIFINDSDHSADYERREYEVVADKLCRDAVVIGDNAHVSGELMAFSRATGRRFMFFREEPDKHWYSGGGIGISFKGRPTAGETS